MTDKKDYTELKLGEPHPSARHALEWYTLWRMQNMRRYMMFREAVASTALSGNRMAEVCQGTLDRLDKGEPVSDRYVLGLIWFIKEIYGAVDDLPPTTGKENGS